MIIKLNFIKKIALSFQTFQLVIWLVEIRTQEKFIHKYPEFRDYCSTLLAYETGFLRFLKIPEIILMVSQIIGKI